MSPHSTTHPQWSPGATLRVFSRRSTQDTLSKTMTKFEPPRDHPRAVPGMREVGRGWGANSDTQLVVAPKEDLPSEIEIQNGEFMASLDRYCAEMRKCQLGSPCMLSRGFSPVGIKSIVYRVITILRIAVRRT